MQEHTQGTVPDIRHTMVFKAPIQKVWDTVSTSEGIAAWFMPNDFQPVLGYEFTLNADQFGISHCKVTELDPPNRLAFSWGQDWQVSFDLKDLEGKTEFTLIHSGWEAGKLTEFNMPHEAVRERMNQGWGSIILEKLAKVIDA
ncbi:SRPBCC family protein [Paenibacillus radicis (ex Xue et al. 2023)]|uniref:SRPBCC domain-containing protein n=1 Tax=Paenibacillus radicis (ex Xue et al. 2023) TaxID=2972489 RepID=A0ABT1YR35_9BACL|nr:SRPBCC domain-containing protein [Paenibacillus radicis (ex Xue et al. 2023)]MCR8635649.1 SRPBCC domain-containing protein [Paenibacillus radicis (ex Xue et al. 2023)]